MPGPPPNPDRRRRNAGPQMTRLPASGRDGDAPKWPLTRPKKAELQIWEELWSSPQATMWEPIGALRTVARYVRVLVEAERPGAPATLQGEVRQFEDRLGLTPMAMLRLHWEIAPDEVGAARADRAPATPSSRRLVAVDPDAVAQA